MSLGVPAEMDGAPAPSSVRAAGGVVRRVGPSGPEIALVHRPRYDDWTLPKGKADAGESDEASAMREVLEETGLRCELGPEVAQVAYLDNLGRPKTVRYWLMYPVSGGFVPNDEVDRLRWVSEAEAMGTLTYGHDRDVIRRAVGFDAPLALVRHAKASDRLAWSEDDRLRPLTKKGRRQAEGLVERFEGRGVDRIISSPYVRCVQTVRPLALARHLPVEEEEVLAEASELPQVLAFLRGLSGAVVLCSHGDVIPSVVLHLEQRGLGLVDPPDWKKGSTWFLERDGGLFTAARYVPPPDA
jgi:phosphohistidine phosphatase SixA/predicted NUDIX family NTP pyrophosphohydrolase